MLDYQRIVDDVRVALMNNADAADDFLQAVAADYSLAIDEANQRLSACGALLRKGLRSEAIQLSEIEPNLLDVVEILDFPERDTWNELLFLRSLSVPASLMLDVAANLNEAYAIDRPLATLLERHRLLAMSRGPMKLRMETLRKLAAADPDNSIWEDDVRTFEEERIKELQREVPAAIFRGNAAALDALAAELEDTVWRTAPPVALLQQVTSARSQEMREQGVEQLRRAADQLNSMYAAFDVDGGHAAKSQWEQLYSVWGQFAPAELPESVGAALDWLREQDALAAQSARHKRAVGQFVEAVNARKPAAELYRLRRDAAREGEIPSSVEECYQAALEAQARDARLKVRVVTAIVAALVLVLAGVIGLFVWQSFGEQKVNRALAILKPLVRDDAQDERNANNFTDARNNLNELDRGVAADSRIKEITQKVDSWLKEWDRLNKGFKDALAHVQDMIDKKELDAAEDSLKAIKPITAAQQQQITDAKAEIKRMRDGVQEGVDKQFTAKLDKLEDRLGKIQDEFTKDPQGNLKTCDAQVETLKSEHTALERENPQISAAAKQRSKKFRDDLDHWQVVRDPIEKQLEFERAILTPACSDCQTFETVLNEYVRKFPNSSRVESFRKVAAKEPPLWKWVSDWSQMVQSVGRRNCATFDKKSATEQAVKLRTLLDAGGLTGWPNTDAFRQRLPCLDAISHRSQGEGKGIESLKPVLEREVVSNVSMLTDARGRRYYLQNPPQWFHKGDLESETTYGFDYAVDFEPSQKHTRIQGGDIKDRGEAPQQKTAKALGEEIDRISDTNWDASFCRMIDIVLRDKESEPLLMHYFLHAILEAGCDGSPCFDKGFRGMREIVNASGISLEVNWVDPENREAETQRHVADAELVRLRGMLDAAKKAADAQTNKVGEPIGAELNCVGWLRKVSAGGWECLVRPDCKESGNLYVARIDEQNPKTVVFTPAGSIDQGKAVINPAAGAALVEGRPVYLSIPPK